MIAEGAVASSADPDLLSIARVLAGSAGQARALIGAKAPGGSRALAAFAVLPGAKDPRWLLPLSCGRAASTSLRRFNRGSKSSVRLRAELVALAMRLGVGGALVRDRLLVVVDEAAAGGISGLPLAQHLGEVLSERDLEIAVRLGPVRPNRKPVLQILTRSGRELGYAKVGWNATTASLVRNEARMLATFAASPPLSFAVPRLIHFGNWAGMDMLVVAPLPECRWRWSGPHLGLPLAATREIAGLFGVDEGRLDQSAYWRRTGERIERIGASGGGVARRLAGILADLERRHGDQLLAFGTWHGDWTPANMGYSGGSLFVWDWERCGQIVPLGLDVVHFAFRVGLKFQGKQPGEAARQAIEGSGVALEELGVPSRLGSLLMALDLLEVSLRIEEARIGGRELTDPIYLGVLEQLARQAA